MPRGQPLPACPRPHRALQLQYSGLKLLGCSTEFAAVVVGGRLGFVPAYDLDYCLDRPEVQRCTRGGGACTKGTSSCCSSIATGKDTCTAFDYPIAVRPALRLRGRAVRVPCQAQFGTNAH